MNTTDATTKTTAGSAAKKFKRPRTLNDLRNDPRVEKVWNEGEDGWWISLRDGYVWDDCSGIHESTVRALCEQMANVEEGEPC